MSPLPIRRLAWRDMPAVERHLPALGPADRRKRFLSPATDAAVRAYVARIDPDRAALVGATDGDGRVVGVAEARPVADAPRTVELAATVHPYHRREGFGRRLAARAASLAFAGGAGAALFPFAPENRAGAALARSLGARFAATGRALPLKATFDGGGEKDAAAPGALDRDRPERKHPGRPSPFQQKPGTIPPDHKGAETGLGMAA